MDIDGNESIAASFPANYINAELGITLSAEQFEPFKTGIYAGSMDEKWNIFVLGDVLFFSRSWTNNCIFKVYIEEQEDLVLLKNVDINNDPAEYRVVDIKASVDHVKWIIQLYLSRQEVVDPKLKLPFIRDTIRKEDPDNECSKIVGSRTVAQVRHIYNALNSSPNDELFTVRGWVKFEANLLSRVDKEALVSIYITNKAKDIAKTLYFDETANELLGSIIIEKIRAE
ncbi:hypothetical protein [Mucilaginibacter gilvus]|uniref:Uncharacterized protein n=1 Tax=Mucilaginibacter gilvus TaxID=2305909 RepID=A0A444MNM2_9SPHI|nr:hypothetical protein [Mucilaginibacter gilvus]RWY52242.1 hypothetical protein EPL05_09995 [Mucilaginibacter gilvus]